MAMTEVLTSIPIPESHAVSEAPIQFRAAGIAFRVPLLPLEAYKIFNAAIHAVKFRMANIGELNLRRLMELDSEKDSESEEKLDIGDILSSAYTNFQERFGSLPDDLVDIIAGISIPLNIPKTLLKLSKWADGPGLLHSAPDSWQLPESEEAVRDNGEVLQALRKCVGTFLKWNMTVDEAVDLLHDLARANSQIKKKLVGGPQAAKCVCLKSDWRRNLCRTRQKFSPDDWVCMTSR